MNKAMTQKELREWGEKAWGEAVKQSQYTPWFPGGMNKAMTQKELREWGDKAWSEAVKQSQYTPWFHPTDTPERVGVYQRIRWNEDAPFFSYWDGRRWWPSGVTADEAFARYVLRLPYGVPRWISQVLQWRGRTENV